MKYRPLRAMPVRSTVSSVFRILILTTLAATVTGYECRGARYQSTPIPEKTLTLSQFVGGIVSRSAGLNYVTEQDSEVFAFYRNTPVKEVTDSVFLTLLRRPAQTEISQHPWSAFFQGRTRNDPTGRWRDLQQYLEANLTNVTVFRLPREDPYDSQYDLYAVGIFNGDTVVGVQMFGVAT